VTILNEASSQTNKIKNQRIEINDVSRKAAKRAKESSYFLNKYTIIPFVFAVLCGLCGFARK
jgi:hypothetical protein